MATPAEKLKAVDAKASIKAPDIDGIYVPDDSPVVEKNIDQSPDRSLVAPVTGFSFSSAMIYMLMALGPIASVLLFLTDVVRFPTWVLFFSTAIFLMIGTLHYLHVRKLVSVSTRNDLQLKKQLEEIHDRNWELQESEERYRGLAEAFGDMILHRDAHGKVIYVNDAVTKGFNKPAEHFIGKEFTPKISEEIHQTGHAYPAIIREFKIDMADGERWLAWFDLPMRDEVTGENSIRSVARDITKQKETEIKLRGASSKAQAASEAKSRFLANVSHEMRTPLNGILGMSGLLSDTELSAEQESYVDAVHNSGSALLSLIEDILDMSLVEAGKITLKSEPVKPVRLLEDVCELLSSRAHEKGITISSFVSNSVPTLIQTDAGRLRQVLINLIGNALKFTEQGGVYAELSALPSINHDGKTRLKFTVHDTGPGIAKEHQSLIFDEFSQSDSESTREHGGAGLGLTISQRIIRAMGGKINVASETGFGSQFCFEIDLMVLEKPDQSASNALAGRNILMVGLPGFQETAVANYISEHSGLYQSYVDLTEIDTSKDYDNILIKHDKSMNVDAVIEKLRAEKFDLSKTIVVLEPEARNVLGRYKASGVEGYLIEPIRSNSLLRILQGGRANDAEEVQTSNVKKWAASLTQTVKTKKILLAEDNDINAMLASTLLQKAGHSVTRVMNGEEALHLWQETQLDEPFDLILMDLQMPLMDGLDSLRAIRNQEDADKTPAVPVFILTADEQPETREKAKASKANGFLTKPLDPDLLLNTIADI